VSHIGRCATRFDETFSDIDGLVAALSGGRFDACRVAAPDALP
jgi:hypothetical protein